MTISLRREAVWTALSLLAVAFMIWFELIYWWFPLVFIPFGFVGGYLERRWRARTARDGESNDRRA